MLLILFLVLLCFQDGALQQTAIKQDPTKCTFAAAGNYEVMYYLLQAGDKKHLAYCTDFDNDLQGDACQLSRSLMFTMHMSTMTPGANDLIMNMDFAVLDEEISQNTEINMNLLGTPISYWIKGNRDTTNIEFHIYKSNVVATDEYYNNCGFFHRGLRLYDTVKSCNRVDTCLITSDPLSLDYLNMALYVNQKNAKKAYFFVKKNTNVAIYPIPFPDLLDGQTVYMNNHEPVFDTVFYSMPLIQNFPHENYQEHFFAFDPHYGCFALLYWDGNRAHFPEVHYYYFDEDHPSYNVRFVDRIVLHGFDWFDIFDKTKGYHENIMTFPVFKSFGRQVYIGIQKTPGSDHHRYRIWSPDPTKIRGSDDCNFETTYGRRRTFVIDSRFINREKATGETSHPPPPRVAPITVPAPPAPITVPQQPSTAAPAPAPITLPPLSTAAPISAEPITVTPPVISVTTEAPTENPPISSTSLPTTAKTIDPKDNSKVNGNDGLSSENEEEESGSFFCGPIHNSLWGMLLFILFDVILAVILIAIIVMAYIGKKKMKAAEKSKKGGKKNRKGKAPKTKTANTTSGIASTVDMEKTGMATTGENMEKTGMATTKDDENEKDTLSNQSTFQTVVEKVIPKKKKDKKKKNEKKEESSSKNSSIKKDENKKKDAGGGGASSKKKKKNKK